MGRDCVSEGFQTRWWPQGTSVGEDSFSPSTSQVYERVPGVLGWWWHPCWLTRAEAASHRARVPGEGAVLGTGPGVVSVAPPEAELPGFGLQHWAPAQPGLSAPSPAPPRGAAPQLPSIPFQPRERCPLPTLSHCLGISPENLSAFCCPYLHLFRLIYTFTSSPLPLGAFSSLCQLYSRPFLDLSWWPWGHCPVQVRRAIHHLTALPADPHPQS